MSTRGRLAFWLLLVAVLATAAYAQRATEGRPERDLLYRYGTAIASAVGYAVMLALTLLIALHRTELLALRTY